MSKSSSNPPPSMEAATGLPVGCYSTRAISPADRHEAWRQRHWPSLAPFYETRPLECFDVESREVQIGGLRIIDASITAQHYERADTMLRASDPDFLAVQFMVEGQARGVFGDTAFTHVAGSVLFGDMARTSRHESTASRSATLAVPRDVALRLGIDPAVAHGQVIAGAAAGLLGAHLLQIVEAAPMLPAAREEQLARTILDLLVIAADPLRDGGSGRVAAMPGAAVVRARGEIENRLGSPTLTVGDLARRLGMSRSSLHRLFATNGGVRAYIRERRLEAALRALQGQDHGESIGSIAERLGFSDGAHLSRLFRARFGMTPSDARAGAALPDYDRRT